MLNKIVEIIPLFSSIVALIISIYSLSLTKRKNINECITKSRIEWISNVRKVMTDFLIEYTSPNCNHKKLLNYKITLETFFTYSNEIYNETINAIDYCLSNKYNGDLQSLKPIIASFQIPINYVWRKAKQETGLDKKVHINAKLLELSKKL